MNEPRSSRPGTVRAHVVQPGVIETVYRGYISTRLVQEAMLEFRERLSRNPSTHWILDATAITGFDPKAALMANSWVELFKQQGGQMMIAVVASSAVRMVASTLGFAAGIPIKTVATHQEAIAALPPR